MKLLNYFIDAALECFNTGNFNSMMGILGRDIHFNVSDKKEKDYVSLLRKECYKTL